MSAEPKHFPLGGSTCKRWTTCHASVRAEAKIAPLPPGPAALEGTKAHALLEHCLRNGVKDANKVVYFVLDGALVANGDADMCGHINTALDFIWSIALKPGVKMGVEQKFRLDHIDPRMGGTCDVWLLEPDGTLWIIDLKYGRVIVEVLGNEQTLFYGVGCAYALKKIGLEVKRAKSYIIQPRAAHTDGPIRGADYTFVDLLDFTFTLREAAKGTLDPNASFRTGDHCLFCRDAPNCKALQEEALAAARDDFEEIIDPTTLSGVELGKRYLQLGILETYVKVLKDHANAEAAAGRIPPNLKYVEGRGKRIFNPNLSQLGITAALATMSNANFLTEPELVSVAQAEEIAGQRIKNSPEFKALWQKKRGAAKLVSVDDKREAITPSANVFEEIEEYRSEPDE